MRFVSKNANLMVVLKPGLPGSHLTGQAPVTGIYVKFQNGMVEIKDEKLIDGMKLHPGFNSDFIAVEEKELDPYAHTRSETEPVHFIQEMEYGHLGGAKKSITPAKISPELQKFIELQATNMAKAMLPSMMKELLSEMKKNSVESFGKTEQETVAEEEKTETNVKIVKTTNKGKIKKDEVEETPTI